MLSISMCRLSTRLRRLLRSSISCNAFRSRSMSDIAVFKPCLTVKPPGSRELTALATLGAVATEPTLITLLLARLIMLGELLPVLELEVGIVRDEEVLEVVEEKLAVVLSRSLSLITALPVMAFRIFTCSLKSTCNPEAVDHHQVRHCYSIFNFYITWRET